MVNGDIPPGRNGHTATLAHSKIVVIGGWLGSGPLAAEDVWILDVANRDCVSWEHLPPIGEPPGPCNMHSADFLACRNEVFVFRGGNGREVRLERSDSKSNTRSPFITNEKIRSSLRSSRPSLLIAPPPAST